MLAGQCWLHMTRNFSSSTSHEPPLPVCPRRFELTRPAACSRASQRAATYQCLVLRRSVALGFLQPNRPYHPHPGSRLFLNIGTNNDRNAPAVYTATIYTKARQGGASLSSGGVEEMILPTGSRPDFPLEMVRIRITSDQTGGSVLAECSFPFTLLASPALDSDGDGLLAVWEQNGFDANMDGTVDVDLPKIGADPCIRIYFWSCIGLLARSQHKRPSRRSSSLRCRTGFSRRHAEPRWTTPGFQLTPEV